jgi:hypothetical protein
VKPVPTLAKPLEGEACGLRCIYFLVRDGIVVYVGQTAGLGQRIRAHKLKQYDSVWIVEAAPDELNTLEAYWIGELAPEYNSERRPNYIRGTNHGSGPRAPVSFVASNEEREAYWATAREQGLTLSAWLRSVANRAAGKR